MKMEMDLGDVGILLNLYNEAFLRRYEMIVKSGTCFTRGFVSQNIQANKAAHRLMGMLAEEAKKDKFSRPDVIDSFVSMNGRYEKMIEEMGKVWDESDSY